MKFFVYTDYKDYISDYKQNKWPVKSILFICQAEDISAADKLFEIKIGKSPLKMVMVGCAPVDSLDEFILEFNKLELKVLNFNQQIKKFNYVIYGLENPWLKDNKNIEYNI